ncbi:MAG: hypothetical protein HY068_03290 [Burkholderiales bacterium]|nr:hypothetical protein [Burkholderiales bacterium]
MITPQVTDGQKFIGAQEGQSPVIAAEATAWERHAVADPLFHRDAHHVANQFVRVRKNRAGQFVRHGHGVFLKAIDHDDTGTAPTCAIRSDNKDTGVVVMPTRQFKFHPDFSEPGRP